MADDLGYGDLGCYGQEKIKSPNIDRLAADGIRFTQAYAGCTVCAPSRSVLMTGQHTGHTRVRGNFCHVGGTLGYKNNRPMRRMNLLDEDTTVAHVLREAGYRTCLTGKWHIGGYNPDAGPLNRGFDEFYGPLTITSALHNPSYWPPKWYENDSLVDVPGNQEGRKGYYKTDLITDQAIGFMERNRTRPFFLYIAYSNPHSPFDAPGLGPYEKEDWPLEEKIYAAMIYRLDSCVGRIRQALDRLRLTDNTIVFLVSDNGPRSEAREDQTRVVKFFDSNGPLTGYKRDMYEGGIRVPGIVWWPGKIPAGRTSDLVWYFADFLPTATALAGTDAPVNMDGINFLPYLADPALDPPERFLYWEFYEQAFRQAVRWKNWKAMRTGLKGELELYDLSKDIAEQNDISKENPSIILSIEEYLKDARVNSPNWIAE
jgi:arylsulfatase A-like enzyme